MRTRRSNRTKSYAIEKYDFEGSSDEELIQRAGVDNDDDNFEAAAAVESVDEEELALEQEAAETEASVSDPEGAPDHFQSQTVKPIRPFNVRAVGVTGFLDVEPVADRHFIRTYCGAYDRSLRGYALLEAWYSRHPEGYETALAILERWKDWTVLPPKVKNDEESEKDKGIWSPNFFEREAYNAEHWYERVRDSMPGADSQLRLSKEAAEPYRFQRGPMPVLMGPYESQQEYKFRTGDAYTLSQSGIPLEEDGSDGKVPNGWIFNVGGIVTGMDWAPQQTPHSPQILALCVVPYSDQEFYDFQQESAKPDFQKHGVIQLWEFHGEWVDGYLRPAQQLPKLRKTLCLEHGRARRVRWSPACGLLAVLCDDGEVYVFEARVDGDGDYDQVQQPISVFSFVDEQSIKAASLTWVNFNRLVVGYTDGSIALWSVCPSRLLSRHPLHHNHIVDVVSGYPSMPYIIATSPLGGTTRLVDLRAPSFETTEVQSLTITTQPNLLGYSDHLLGFFSTYPSAGPLKTHIGFMHHAHYPVARRIFTGESFLSCLSVGRTHPFLLVGSMDGSLWALNPQVEIFSTRREPSDRIRVFHHDHRPAKLFSEDSPASASGVSRIVQGFLLERNLSAKTDFKPPTKKSKKVKGKKKPANEAAAGDVANEEDDGAGSVDPTRAIIYEPLTRITAVEWNPNVDYGYWAAAAMGSGLVRVMDLGVET
ncbi:hypothetical protein G7046_g5933 [Stylonectria norvegica]|nr:hypothetical protein G7046_g5933 [Stylonectria norvegica]